MLRLNHECLRDVLLKLEELDYFTLDSDGNVQRGFVYFDDLCSKLPEYNKVDIFYAISNLKQAGYITETERWPDGEYHGNITSITFQGHEFLASIHDTDQWKSIKKALPAVRNYSLSAITAIANGMTTALINAHFRKNH